MFSKKKQSKSVIKITDTNISYLTLEKNQQGFFVSQHNSIDIPNGIIKKGEILKADIFLKLLRKIQSDIKNKEIDVLFAHDFFLCNDIILGSQSKSTSLKKRVKAYFNNLSENQPWHKTHVCEFQSFNIDKKESLLLTCLPVDIQQSYIHVLKKSGLKVQSINSDILALGHLLPEKNSSLIYLSRKKTRIIDFKQGMYIGNKTFQFSYEQLINDIMKNVSLSEEEALKILQKYGVLRAHKDESVYKRVSRSMAPLLDFFSKRKSKNELNIFVVYDKTPIKGFADTVSYSARNKVIDFDVFNVKKYLFQEPLPLHKKDSYEYQSHIAQALLYWKIK